MNLIACLDVHYADPRAAAACVVLASWQASEPEECVVRTIDNVMPYEPGAFYRRELPCIEEVLKALRRVPEILVVDGYVWVSTTCTTTFDRRLFPLDDSLHPNSRFA